MELLTFTVGEWKCALPLSHVAETMRPLPCEPIAGAPAFITGLSVIRGEPTPVVDAARLLRGVDIPSSRLISLRVGDRKVALAVTSVLGVEDHSDGNQASRPPLLDPELDTVQTLSQRDQQLFVVLSAARMADSLDEGGSTGELSDR